MPNISPIPEGFHTITPHLIIKNAAGAIDFYKKALGAQELSRHMMPDGQLVMHSLLKVGNSMLMIVDEFPEGQGCPDWVSPQTNQGTTVLLHLYVEDVDAVYNQAVAAGCTPSMPPMDAFWGDRYGQVVDPFGHFWSMATHISNPTEEEMAKAAEEILTNAPD